MDVNLKQLMASSESNLDALHRIESSLNQCLEHLVGMSEPPNAPMDTKSPSFILTSWGNTIEQQRIVILSITSKMSQLRDIIGLNNEDSSRYNDAAVRTERNYR